MRYQFLIAFVLGLAGFGCGGGPDNAPEIAPAAGVVNLNGTPLPNATVTFYPEAGPAGLGIGDASGQFRVKTNGSDGAVIGKNRVTVSTPQSSGEIPPADGNEIALLEKPTIPAKYLSAETTDLIVEIPPDGNVNLKLDLTD